MRRSTILLTALAAMLYLGASSIFAQHGHAGGAGSHGGEHAGHMAEAHSTTSRTGKTAADRLQHNPRLSSKLDSILKSENPPVTTDLQTLASGFKNMGQFVAAVHVSKNLGIPFDQLKSTMVGPPAKSLGQAIHTIKPDVDSKAEARKGTHEANEDIKESNEKTS